MIVIWCICSYAATPALKCKEEFQDPPLILYSSFKKIQSVRFFQILPIIFIAKGEFPRLWREGEVSYPKKVHCHTIFNSTHAMAPETEANILSSTNACTFGEISRDSSTARNNSSSSSNSAAGSSTSSTTLKTTAIAGSNIEIPFQVLLDMVSTYDIKVEKGGDDDLIYDVNLGKWVVKKPEESTIHGPAASSKLPVTTKQSTTNNSPSQPNPANTMTSPPPSSSKDSKDSKNSISSLFAERAARFANTEVAARSADLAAKKAAEDAEQARLKARRERVERLAKEKLEDVEQLRGKEWERKAYEEKVRAKAVMEAERKKREDILERERIKRNIADDEERRRLARERLAWKYGGRMG